MEQKKCSVCGHVHDADGTCDCGCAVMREDNEEDDEVEEEL